MVDPCCCTFFVAVNYDDTLAGYNSFSSGPSPQSSPVPNTNTCGSFELGSGGTVTITPDGANLNVVIAGVSACFGALLFGLNGAFTALPDGGGNWTAAVGSATFGALSGNGTLLISPG